MLSRTHRVAASQSASPYVMYNACCRLIGADAEQTVPFGGLPVRLATVV